MNQDFLDVFQALFATNARFLVVGAFAVSVHAEPRATGDLDVWVDPASENARRVYEALKRFGAPLADLSVQDLSSPDIVFQMGLAPNRIDILTSVSGLTFEEAWKTHETFEFAGLMIPVIGREALIRNKKAAGRPRDLIDLEILTKHRPPRGTRN
ncbi:MAG: hypothetical protein V1798_01200 [Pseudomonadota bacterium]